MILAPHIIRQILNPLRSKIPKVYGATLILVGVLTVTFRLVTYYDLQTKARATGNMNEMMCH